MADQSAAEIISALAAVVSAVGGAFASVAAFRSAASAREAARSADESNRRALQGEVSDAADSILVAVLAVKSRGTELMTEYKTAEVFSGSAENSNLHQMREAAQSLLAQAESFLEDAKLFVNGARSLSDVPFDEVDRVRVRLRGKLKLTQTIHDELDRKYETCSAQNAQRRQAVHQARGTQ